MSTTKSRLGKGLGALFPALPGENALVNAEAKNNENVSHETLIQKDVFNDVSRETKVPSIDKAISPHEGQNNVQKTTVSRETVPPIANKNKHSSKRSSMPSIDDVTRPIDFFFGDSASKTFVSSKLIMHYPLF